LSLAGLAIAGPWPRAVFAAPMKRVGIIGVRGGGTYTTWKQEFPKEFASLGWIEGRNLELLWYDVFTANGEPTNSDLREAGRRRAAEMAAAGLDCMVVNGEPQARMLQGASIAIPIVADVPDPVRSGFARTLAHPGGNMTGLHDGREEIALKTAEMLRRLVPATSCMTWIGPENFQRTSADLESAARALGLRFRSITFGGDSPADIANLRAQMAALRKDGCITGEGVPFSQGLIDAMAATALENRLALASGPKKEGFLLRYTSQRTPEQESAKRIPVIVSRILRGEKPGEIPFEGPTRYQLMINLRTAARLGINVPRDVLVLANEVVR
jgi:putative ABC transport system substrate-binding protein